MALYGHTVKIYYFLKNLLLYSCASSRQSEYVVMMSKEASTKIVYIMTPGAGVPVIVCGPIWPYSENALFLENILLYALAYFRNFE